jgi:hypothetical protein
MGQDSEHIWHSICRSPLDTGDKNSNSPTITKLSWNRIVAQIKSKAQDDYARTMIFDKRIRYVHEQLYSKVWYIAQIFSPPEDCIRQLNTISARFVWREEILKVPLSTLHLPKVEGGWNLIHVKAKCRTLLLNRTQHFLANNKSTSHTWLAEWQINGAGNNPPIIAHLPNGIDYIRQHTLDVAYVGQQAESESRTAYGKRLFPIMLH